MRYLIDLLFGYISALDKGYGENEYIFWYFFTLPIDAAMVIAMPNKKLLTNQID